MRPRTLALCSSMLVGVAIWSRHASACSCASVGGGVEVESADVGFVGRVVSVDVPVLLHEGVAGSLVDSPLGPTIYGFAEPTVQVGFEIERWYTTPRGATVVIDTGSGFCCDCSLGASLVVGERYLVGASEYEGALHVSTCNRPMRESDEPADFALRLEELGPGYPPWGEADSAWMQHTRWQHWALGAMGVVVLLVVGRLHVRRCDRRDGSTADS